MSDSINAKIEFYRPSYNQVNFFAEVKKRIKYESWQKNEKSPAAQIVLVTGVGLSASIASAATPAAVFDQIAALTPLRSVTTPAEAADAVLFFASPWARAVTG